MAQIYNIENNLQQTVNFSIVDPGDIFLYSGQAAVKLDNNNPNYVIIDTGAIGKLDDTDQIILPESILLKLE